MKIRTTLLLISTTVPKHFLHAHIIFCFCCDSVFKVIGIEESGFVEKTNLRVGRINLNFSITDVQWHPVDGKWQQS